MRGAISHPGAFLRRRRLLGLSRRGIALAVLASLFVNLIACAVAVTGHAGPATDGIGTPAHHSHLEGDPEQAECCGIVQDASMSTRQRNVLPSLFVAVVLLFPIYCFRFKPSVRLDLVRPPSDTAGPSGRPHLESTLRPRAPPR